MKKLAIHAALVSMFFVAQANAAKKENKKQEGATNVAASPKVATQLPKKSMTVAKVSPSENLATSTVVLPKDETKSSLGGSLIIKSNTAFKDSRASQLQGFVGPNYKIDKNNSIGFRHYFAGTFETSQLNSEDKSNHLTLQNSIDSFVDRSRGNS